MRQRSLARVVALLVLSSSVPAAARRGGIVTQGCQACHGESAQSTLALSAEPVSFGPGELVTFTATIQRAGVAVGGIYVASPEVGQLRSIAGEGLSLVTGGLTHNSPKAAQSGRVTFRFQWQAPSAAGSLRLAIYALAANGDNQPTGDAPSNGVFSYAFGCNSQTFYFDGDGDGYGGTLFPSIVGCAGKPPRDYSATSDDCDDGRDTVHPGAAELCNARDDNCDGRADEGAKPEPLWPDPDGDGFYGANAGASLTGCLPLAGYARDAGDCAPQDAARHPGTAEVCNQLDDNCDGRVDEGIRPQCGVGWCRRESITCRPEDCQPGLPSVEACNGVDDDCDGEVDEGCSGQTAPSGGALGSGGASFGGGAASGGASLGGGGTLGGGRALGGGSAFGGGIALGGVAGAGSAGLGEGGSAAESTRAADNSGCSLSRQASQRSGHYLALVLFAAFWIRRRSRCGRTITPAGYIERNRAVSNSDFNHRALQTQRPPSLCAIATRVVRHLSLTHEPNRSSDPAGNHYPRGL